MAELDLEFRGKLALITGATTGPKNLQYLANPPSKHRRRLRACSLAQWRQLALTCASGEEKMFALEEELRALRLRPDQLPALLAAQIEPLVISMHEVDLAQADSIEHLFTGIAKSHGKLGPDILVSNAGYGKLTSDVADIDVAEFDHTISVNLRAAFILSKLSIPHMAARRWGRIVYVSSLAAHGASINGCHYAASKAGLHGLMKSLAAKHARDGITVNDVAPGMIGETGMIPDASHTVGTAGNVRNIPVGRLGRPDEVAKVVVMFCSTGYMTDQSVVLAGELK
ncbi:hypothetical protein B0T22DRAFT_246175 [Podospora appendiculata]|uniref:3-oxoacyl-[acyl-carrier-protein] reductase n=1 Tax=Podospora appendiculata TaxID=314037 RepID=A0AAE1C8R4_9PEZI|nr:hypothetical protein B0T22DRAFT_246175 [Podospora appendiculata]